MAEIILLCGKIGSGKTTYAVQLCRERGAVLLSVDELMLAMHDPYLGERHDAIAAQAQEYLWRKALEIAKAGTTVVLDWGFWTQKGRADATARCAANGIRCEWHGIFPPESVRRERIAARNSAVLRGESTAYFVDEGLENKLQQRFEMPEEDEMEIWIES